MGDYHVPSKLATTPPARRFLCLSPALLNWFPSRKQIAPRQQSPPCGSLTLGSVSNGKSILSVNSGIPYYCLHALFLHHPSPLILYPFSTQCCRVFLLHHPTSYTFLLSFHLQSSLIHPLYFLSCTPFFKRVWLAFFTSNTNSATVCFSVSSRTILSTFTMLILLMNLTFYVPLSLLTVHFLFLCRTARSKLIMKQFNGNNACIAKILHLCRLKGNSLHQRKVDPQVNAARHYHLYIMC